MSAFHDNALMGASGQQGYKISRSVRLRSSASAYFNRTFSTPTNALKFSWSAWVKRGSLGGQMLFGNGNVNTGTTFSGIYFDSADRLYLYDAGSFFIRQTNAVYRDPSAWYHIMFSVDKTSSVNVNLYVNGVQVTSFADSRGTLLTAGNFNSAVLTTIGKNAAASDFYFDGYLTDINFIDGQALTPSSFGETDSITGVWKPKKYAGTYGTNGFYLNFSDNSGATATTIGKDYSGNGNNWTPNNISVTAGATYDSMIDVPTLYADGGNGRGNYCVMNPLNPDTVSLNGSLTNGNLNASGTTYGVSVFSCTFQVPQSGKWYWETVYTTITNTVLIGIRSYSTSSTDVRYYSNGNKEVGASTTAYGASWTTNDVIGVAVDRDAGTVVFYKNNASQGSISIPTNSAQFDITFNTTSPFGSTVMSVNFGQRPFSYTPPTGFLALNTQNLPAPTISNGANYMAATTYTANASTQTINNAVNGVSFQPDLVWTKSRTGAYSHEWFDVIRGVNAYIGSNNTAAEVVGTAQLTSFNSNGFTLGANENSNYTNGYAAVAWQWKAGGTAVSNTAGSITSSVSANTTAGFSVATFTAQTSGTGTFGHGLGVAPSMVIVKQRASAGSWGVYHISVGNGSRLLLDSTAASVVASSYWNNTSPTSTVVTLGSGFATAGTMVAYCFAEVAGYSKFGSYTGNNTSDGPFIYCGFRPRWIMVKSISTGGTATYGWAIFDTSRENYNINRSMLVANVSDAENTTIDADFDILSNGFKPRYSPNYTNGANTYIFAAFAEVPFKYSLAR